MDEAKLAELMAQAAAKAVAEYDARSTWGEEILANSETIAVLLVSMIAGAWGLIRWVGNKQDQIKNAFHELDKRLASMEGYKETHDREDREAHSRLEHGDQEVLRELREFRAESTQQHNALAQRLEDSVAKGEAGRQRLYDKSQSTDDKLAEVSESVATLVGYHEARKDAT